MAAVYLKEGQWTRVRKLDRRSGKEVKQSLKRRHRSDQARELDGVACTARAQSPLNRSALYAREEQRNNRANSQARRDSRGRARLGPPPPRERVRLCTSALGDDATLMGAAELGFAALIANPLGRHH